MQVNLLLIGGLGSGGSSIATLAKQKNMRLTMAENVPAAIEHLCQHRVDMAFISAGLDLPDFFGRYNESRLNTPVVAVGDASNVQHAVKAIRLGAIEYLTTPIPAEALTELTRNLGGSSTGPISADPKMHKVLEVAKKFAASNASVLVRGESGTGKEVLSRFIHDNSPRKSGPFVSVNCAAIPENLLESELFGHEKGAFSGAINKRLGKFQQADGGTLLLDEISEMDIALQAKLLRAIQERVIDPVGSTQPVPVDIRLIATTNRNLEEQVKEGTFREDLYFRLNVVTVELPALRERPGDILALAGHFAGKFGGQYGIEPVTISPDAQKKLTDCYWKGNVRELENTIHRAVLMMDGNTIGPDAIEISAMSRGLGKDGAPTSNAAHLAGAEAEAPARPAPAPARPASPLSGAASAYANASSNFEKGKATQNNQPLVGRTVQDVEKELILSTLDYCQGNRTHAANILGISIRTLRNKLKEYEDGTPFPADTSGAQAAGQ